MARFLDSTTSIKKEAGKEKKKKKQNPQKAKPAKIKPSTQATVNRLQNKYAGGSTRGKTGSSKPKQSKPTQKQTVNRLQNKYSGGSTRDTTTRTHARIAQNSANNRRNEPSRINTRSNRNLAQSRNPRLQDAPTSRDRQITPKTARSITEQNTTKRRQQPRTAREMQAQRETEKRLQEKYGTGKVRGGKKTFLDDAIETAKSAARQVGAEESRIRNQIGQGSLEYHGKGIVDQKYIDASKKVAAKRDEKLRQKMQVEAAKQKALEEGHSFLGKAALGAVSSGIGMLSDAAYGPFSLAHMSARVMAESAGEVRDKAEPLKKRMRESGLYTDEEIDNTFRNIDRLDVANMLLQGGIEGASEKVFGAIGLAKGVYGKGILDNVVSKLTSGRLGSSVAGRTLRGMGEEIAEEEIGNPLQALASNLTSGNKLQAVNEDIARRTLQKQSDDLRSNIRSEEDARLAAARINSSEFLKETRQDYIDAGVSKEEASALAELSRDYMHAALTGNTEDMQRLQDEMVSKLTGGDNSLKEKWTLRDALEVGVSTGILTGATGLPAAMTTAATGRAYKQTNGLDGVKKLAQVVQNLDPEKSDRARGMVESIDRGESPIDTQVYELMQWSREAATEAKEREISKSRLAERKMKDEDLLVQPAMVSPQTGYQLAEVTEERFEAISDSIIDRFDEATEDVYEIADTVAAFETGTITAEQINALNVENPENREIFRDVTGIDLDRYNVKDSKGNINEAASNIAMQKSLFAMAADNYVESARLEQENWNDRVRGMLAEQRSPNLGAEGDVAYQAAIESVDPRDRNKFMLTGEAASRVYEYARNTNDTWDDVKADFKSMFRGVDESAMRSVFDAAKADKAKAETKYYGQQIRKNSLTDNKVLAEGKFTNESGRELKNTELQTLSSVASTLALDVVMTDSLADNTNGSYDPGSRTITLNARNTMDENLAFVFSHEVTHHLAAFAPDEYLKLSRYVMDRWFKADPEKYKSEIERIQNLYKEQKNQELSPEQALEELIADQAHNFWNDEGFMDAVTREEPSLAQAIINAIKDILSKLRQILAGGSITDERTREGLFAEIDAYDQAYKLWMVAFDAAKKDAAQDAIDAWNENALTERNNVADKETAPSDDRDIMSAKDIESKLKESFDEYKEDKENLRIATEALDDLQHIRVVNERGSDLSGRRWSLDGSADTQRGDDNRTSRNISSTQYRTIAKGITSDLVNEGYIEFRGRKVASPEDLAKLCQCLRDPRFETFRLVLTKGDRIVSFTSVSSRLPGMSRLFKSESEFDEWERIKKRIKRTNADGYYLIHNHPSGVVDASRADLAVTARAISELGEGSYKGHIILDHDKYGYISPEASIYQKTGEKLPTPSEYEISGQATIDFIHEPEIDHPLLNEQVKGADDIARCGHFVNTSDDISVLLYLDAKLRVKGIQEITNKTLLNDQGIEGFIRNQAVEFGSMVAALYTTDEDVFTSSAKLIEKRLLVDSVVGRASSSVGYEDSGRFHVDPDIISYQELGLGRSEITRRTRVYESAAGIDDYNRKLSITDHDNTARFSISPEMDEEYMDAVNSGNMEEAQRLVDEAAKRAMPDTQFKGNWYHGTENQFTEFNFSEGGKNGHAEGFGIYITNDPEISKDYGSRLIKAFVNVKRPASALTSKTLTKAELRKLIRTTVENEAQQNAEDYDGDVEAAKFDTWISNYTDTYYAGSIDKAIDEVIDSITSFNGNDMDLVQEIMTGMGIRNYQEASEFYDILTETTGIDAFETKWGDESEMADPNTPTIAVVFRSSQIKSADPVTYADDGSVIPLSERFDPENNDIRYSLPTQDSDGNILSDGQIEYFKNSQARDENGRLVPVYHGTNQGGFTIFDPTASDDFRSLFFTSKLAVALTYTNKQTQLPMGGRNEYNPITQSFKGSFHTIEEFLDEANNLYQKAYGWDVSRPVLKNLKAIVYDNGTNKHSSSNDVILSWLQGETEEYSTIEIKLPAMSEGSYAWTKDISAESASELLAKINKELESASSENARQFESGYYACYLNLENPLEVNANGATFDEIFYQGDYYSTRGLAQLAQAQGYDGVIIRDCMDIMGASAEYSNDELHSDIYIAFSSEQIKDIRNLNPTENPDIRYSVTDGEDAKSKAAYDSAIDNSYEALLYYEGLIDNQNVDPETYPVPHFDEERIEQFYSALNLDEAVPFSDPVLEEDRVRMAKSKNDFYTHINAKWRDRWTTGGEVLDIKSVKRGIKDFVTGVMMNSDTTKKYKNDLVKKSLLDVRTAFQLYKQGRSDLASALLYHSAQRMIDGVEFYIDDTFDDYKRLRDYLKATKISLDEEYWDDVDYDAFRKRNFGRLRLVKGNTNVDQIYQDLENEFPEWFNEEEEMTPPDQLLQIEYVLDKVQPYKEAYSSEAAAELAFDIADELYDIMTGGKELKSLADTYKEKFDARTKAMKQRHAEAMLRMRKQRDEGIQAERAKWRAREQKRKENAEHSKRFGQLKKNYDWLTERLVNPTKEKNIPEQLRKPLADLLVLFDFQTERSKALEAKYGRPAQKTLKMRELKDKLMSISAEDDSGELPFNTWLNGTMEQLAEQLDGAPIDSLNSQDIRLINEVMDTIIHGIRNRQNLIAKEKQETIAKYGDGTISAMDSRMEKYGPRKHFQGKALRWIENMLNEGMETPSYFFSRIDPDNKGIRAMYKDLERGEDQYIRNTDFLKKRIREISGKYSKKKKPGSELEKWRTAKSAIKINLSSGETISLTPSQIMSLYCLWKRPQAQQHLLVGGIVPTPVSIGAVMSSFKRKADKVSASHLTAEDINQIIAKLTPEQMKMADDLQSLMSNEMSDWGNETSMLMYGIKMFKEKEYFPLKVSSEVLPNNIDKGPDDNYEKIRNFGFTKPLKPNAQNAVYIDDIFSVVADHCNKMALYNAMAVPIMNFNRVYNYQQKNEDGSAYTVQAKIGDAFTSQANAYIKKFLADLNGNTQTRADANDALVKIALSNYKKAAIGLNGRVALQQITALPRAFMEINPMYTVGTIVTPAAMRDMFEHCPKALWKSWGNYEMDLGRDMEDVMMNKDWSRMDTVTMGVYGLLDNYTWCKIWLAVKREIKAKHKNVKYESPEFYELCNERARDIFNRTQVVDSLFNRSDTMRSKNTRTKMMTSFKAEPTLTYNVFRDALVTGTEMLRDGNYKGAAGKYLRAAAVLSIGAAYTSAMAAIWDAVRKKGDDDDDKKFSELWWVNFLDNWNDNAPWKQWNNIYFISDVINLKDGWGTSNMALEGFEAFWKGYNKLKEKLAGTGGDKTTWYDASAEVIGGLGYIFGLPTKTAMRDIKQGLKWFGIDVFAADGSVNTKIDEVVGGLLDKTKSLDLSEGPDLGDKLRHLFGSYDPAAEGFAINRPKDSEEDSDFDKLESKAAEKAAETKLGTERNSALWDILSDGYTKMLTEGDFSTIDRLRGIYEANGGDVDIWDEKILSGCKTAYKKTIISDPTASELNDQQELRQYMLDHGISDAEISEICYKSDTTRDLKAAMRLNDEDAMVAEMVTLMNAGISDADLVKAWDNRNRLKISTYDGKYKDRFKSTGTYNWPINGTITSNFGHRSSPGGIGSTYHEGLDIAGSMGDPVGAADGGTVIYAGWYGGAGKTVQVQHDDGTITQYSHLSWWGVNVGDTVGQGQTIGNVGSTGNSTGPHLHFAVKKDGKYVDPMGYLD